MKPGTKPQPVELKILRGNPGKRAIPNGTPRPEAKVPRCPSHIKGEARKEWHRIGKRLANMRILTEADGAALELYCEVYSRWLEAEANIKKYGMVIKAPSGFLMQSPYLPIVNKCIMQMSRLLAEFGCTPSSRTRVRTEDNNDEPTMQEKLRDAIGD